MSIVRGAKQLLAIGQMLLAARVIARFLRRSGAQPLDPAAHPAHSACVSVLLPVLNEVQRLSPCLEGLSAQSELVQEILVIDGGSVDGTQQIVASYAARDPRIRLIDATPIALGWNGKAWGLQVGLEHARRDTSWILTIDADVRPAPRLVEVLLAQQQRCGVEALSIATRQELSGVGMALIHPALLTTLVYRFGPPGGVAPSIGQVQANGQCFLASRALLQRLDAFCAARSSRCDDVTIARTLVAGGARVGFYEAGELVSTTMYRSGSETWREWPRSLPMRDQYTSVSSFVGLTEVLLVQALPPALLLALAVSPRRQYGALRGMVLLNVFLLLMRIGVLVGTARAYRQRPWSYWLSPLCDLPAACALWRSAVQRQHRWRGRVLV